MTRKTKKTKIKRSDYTPKPRYGVFRELTQCGYGGLLHEVIEQMYKSCFENPADAANYFGVDMSSVYRWRKCHSWPTMAIRLLIIRHRGYLPTTGVWADCCIRTEHGAKANKPPKQLLYISGFTVGFSPSDIQAHLYMKSDYERLKTAEERAKANRHKLFAINGGKRPTRLKPSR